MTAAIRIARVEDAESIVRLHYDAVHSIDKRFYAQGTLDSWSPTPNQARFQRMRDTISGSDATVLVAEVGGSIEGFVIYSGEDAFIRALYAAPVAQGTGLGRALLSHVESQLISKSRMTVGVKASENAVGFYEKSGYIRGELSTQLCSDGTPLSCVVMYKSLVPTA